MFAHVHLDLTIHHTGKVGTWTWTERPSCCALFSQGMTGLGLYLPYLPLRRGPTPTSVLSLKLAIKIPIWIFSTASLGIWILIFDVPQYRKLWMRHPVIEILEPTIQVIFWALKHLTSNNLWIWLFSLPKVKTGMIVIVKVWRIAISNWHKLKIFHLYRIAEI